MLSFSKDLEVSSQATKYMESFLTWCIRLVMVINSITQTKYELDGIDRGINTELFCRLSEKVSPSIEGYFRGSKFGSMSCPIEESIDSMGQTFSHPAGALI